jgi:hypothetical protein
MFRSELLRHQTAFLPDSSQNRLFSLGSQHEVPYI